MLNIFKKNNIDYICLTIILSCFFLISINNNSLANNAKFDGLGRVRECQITNGVVNVEPINGIGMDGGKDIEFSLGNQVCQSIVAISYIYVKFSIAAMNSACKTGSSIPRPMPSPVQDARDLVRAAKNAPSSQICAAGVINATRSFTTAILSFGVTNILAQNKFKTVKLCGSGWKIPDPEKYLLSASGLEKENQIAIKNMIADFGDLSMNNKVYREFVYGGVEYDDNPADGQFCYDATQPPVNGQYPLQKYYLRGSLLGNFNCQKYLVGSGQNKDGTKLTDQQLADLKKSYDCCVNRSKKYICLQDGLTTTFCRAGTVCNINNIFYKSRFENNERLICAESYSLCPYNFTIEGGTNYCDQYCDGVYENGNCRLPKNITETRNLNSQEWNDLIKQGKCGKGSGVFTSSGTPISEVRSSDCTFNEKVSKCRNHCQYMRHCTIASDSKITPIKSLISPYFSQACIDFVGDSKNVATYEGGIAGSYTNFSAPIAQCFKETMENLFFNRVGHSRCRSSAELPTKSGVCSGSGGGDSSYLPGSGFIYKVGNPVGSKSFFGMIQSRLEVAVKMILSISVMFFGAQILSQKVNILDKKTILLYIFKFAMVGYFALGDAWHSMAFNAVYNLSSDLGLIVYNIRTPYGNSQRSKFDGCQFGVIKSTKGEVIDNTNWEGVNKQNYASDKRYLAIWDTLDCKIAKYLGIGMKASAANIAMLIFASFFTGAIGIYFALAVLFFGIFIVVMTIRALHIFLCSSISIVIFVFISPLIFTGLLFEKTKSIFDAWFKEIIGFGLQVVILFAYIGIVVVVMDQTLVGSATFIGDNPRMLNCNRYCIKANGNIEDDISKCVDSADYLVDPLDDSILCLINIDKGSFTTFPGFEVIGVSIATLGNLFSDPSKTGIRVVTIFKGLIVIFLLYKFMDSITEIASQLTGGTELKGIKPDAMKIMASIMGKAQALVQRARRGSIKLGKYATEDQKRKNEESKDEEKGDEKETRQGGQKG